MMSEESKELLQVGIELMKRLEREETVLPTSRYTNQWRNEVGVVSKQLKEGARFLLFLSFLLENKLKTHRITGVEPTQDIYEVKMVCFRLFKPSFGTSRQLHCSSSSLHRRVTI